MTGPQRNVTGQNDDGDAALEQSRAHRDPEHARHLFRLRDQLAVVAAIAKQQLGTCFLKVAAADLGARDVRGDCEHRDAATLALVQPVN
jgi:hypothetical protein